jgi:hypothetical protein
LDFITKVRVLTRESGVYVLNGLDE